MILTLLLLALPLPDADVVHLAQELSGEIAKRNLEGLTRFHRQRGSQGFDSAAQLVLERAKAYGLRDAEVLRFPADGKIFYGTQRSRPGWDAAFAELWELPDRKLASWDAQPIVLAEDSESADVTAPLVDVGDGTRDADYAGKDVKGKIVLVSAQPGDVQDLAVGKFGAAGIVSCAQNQKTAWWGEDENLIRWGHLETFSPNKTFAFMVSLKTARAFRERLAKGEAIRLHATVKAGQHPSNYEVVTATIPGSDPRLRGEEIALSCHLDHQRPGANDNASGCVTILEVARTMQKLIDEKKLPRPSRTLRFIWPPEVEGTETLLNARPDFAQRIKAVIHLDMVGGGPVTKTVFHVTRGPASLPSFVHEVTWQIASFVNDQSYAFAATGSAPLPFVAPTGGKEALLAQDSPHSMGSDHDVYQDSSFRIPAVYLNDWPDRYIHTNFDSAANIDPTKLLRAGFIAAATAIALADEKPDVAWTTPMPARTSRCEAAGCAVYRRRPSPKGPLAVFGYDYLTDHLKSAGLPLPKLLDWQPPRSTPFSLQPEFATSEQYTYEILNFVDGVRNAQSIRDAVSGEYGAIPLDLVLDYLRALGSAGVIEPAQ